MRLVTAAILALLGACATESRTADPAAAHIHAVVADPDRSAADREIDRRRQPEQLLAFAGVRPGMKVLDMGSGAGYSTELLARAVGPNGIVYGEDAKQAMGKAPAAFSERLKKPAMRNVVRLQRDFDDPVPPDVKDLDLVTFFFYYHDVAYMPVERARMNQRLYEALKPGGSLVIADHSARPGAGVSVVKSLHCIASRRNWCGGRSKPRGSVSLQRPTFCDIPRIRVTRSSFAPRSRSMSSC
jgi:predicted methyltransferase